MKKMIKLLIGGMLLLTSSLMAQKVDDDKMERDIQVAENVLSTLLKQQYDRQHMFFPVEVKGSYQPGYGVVFRLPADFTTPISFTFNGVDGDSFIWEGEVPEMPEMAEMPEFEEMPEGDEDSPDAISYSITTDSQGNVVTENVKGGDRVAINQAKRNAVAAKKQKDKAVVLKDRATKDKEKLKEKKKLSLDSVRDANNKKMIEASRNFLADYADLISQLAPEEKIIITNQGEQPRMWVNKLMNSPSRTHLSIEVTKGEVSQYKQGKLTRDQLLSKIKVLNTETVENVDPDIELLSSIFDRLYQPDLAKTFFTEDRIYYERLKDFGVIYYMQVFSSHQQDYELFTMPTLKLSDLDQNERNKNVIAMYPEFEKELKENVLEYGRTVRSIKDNEVLVFNVKITKCPNCGIPSSLEVSVKGSVLKDYGSGKLDKNAALGKLMIKKGANQ
ncbi:MAG TPA: hypothetical protein VL443_02695 [Cyclobacteriaceae bacterium]|nr:hypothetical protein [Cyclobacteriaceae bacterium]